MSKWISVKDNLPFEPRFYNVFCETDERNVVHSMWFQDGKWYYDNYMISGEPTYSTGWYCEVTHWMPLPQPPKE